MNSALANRPATSRACRRWPTTRQGLLAVLSAVVLALSASPATANLAGDASTGTAGPVDLLCPGWSTTTYEPGMQNQPRLVTISGSGSYGPCASSDPTLTSGTFTASGSGTVSCTSGTFTGTITFHWNNRNSSVVSYTAVIGQRLLGEVVVVVEGTVTDGQFEGDRFTHTVTMFTVVPLECVIGDGVTSTTGPQTITFTSTTFTSI